MVGEEGEVKLIKRENYRVVVNPFFYNWESESAMMAMCKSIKADIKRHVDYTGGVEIDCDSTEICSFCGYEWVVDEAGIPICCEKAVKEWEQNKANEAS